MTFSSWRDDPTAELIGEIQKAIIPFLQAASPPGPAPDRLDQAIEAASKATNAALLVILDQFEEYFLYRSRETRDRPFADELAACINRAGLRVNFLISIREDAYFALGDLFKGRINNVYGNYFHLEHRPEDQSGRAYVWQILSGLPQGESNPAEGQPLNSVAFDPANPDLVVTADSDGYARIFKVSTGNQVGNSFGVPDGSMNAAAFSPDGKHIVTVSRDGYARVWNAADHQQIGGKFGYGSSMTSVEFSHNGKEILTTGNNGFTDTWDATQTMPTPVTIIQEPGTNVPYDAAFSPDDSVVVTAGTDGTAREWDARTGRQLLTLTGQLGSGTSAAAGSTRSSPSRPARRSTTHGSARAARRS